MNENLFIIVLLVLSPIILLAWINIFYLIFNKRKDANQDLSIVALVSLYLTSLAPIGAVIGFHLMNKKIKSTKEFKYSESIRSNGNLILIISIASTVFALIKLKQ